MKFWLFPLLLGVDFLSKVAALRFVPPLQLGDYPFGGIAIFSQFFGVSFSLNTIFNTGAAWGLLSGNPGLLCLVRVLIIGALSTYLYFYHRSFLSKPSVLLIGVGAIGNAIDYLCYGHVVDFFHFVFWGYSFPIFNCADAYITCGVFALMFSEHLGSQKRCA
jgi:signal peptidase II